MSKSRKVTAEWQLRVCQLTCQEVRPLEAQLHIERNAHTFSLYDEHKGKKALDISGLMIHFRSPSVHAN